MGDLITKIKNKIILNQKKNLYPLKMEDKVLVNEENEICHINFQENVKCTPDGSETLLELFLNKSSYYANKNYLGHIVDDKLMWYTYGEVRAMVERLSTFFNDYVEGGETIGIFSVNRYEWLVCEYASYMSNCNNCPLYSTFGAEALKLVFEETEMKICCLSADKAKNVYDILKSGEKKYLHDIILFDNDHNMEEKFRALDVRVHYFDDIMKNCKINIKTEYPKNEDIATLCYTSGTSGLPKGVILTHKNFIANISAFNRGTTKEEIIDIKVDEIYLSYLPLAHVMERLCVNIVLSAGASIGFYRGNPKAIQADYLIVKPTFIIAVPRVLNLFKEKIEEKINQRSFLVRTIFNLALKYKIWRQSHGVFASPILDALIFNKVRKEFGGRIRACLCGAASLKPSVLSFLQATLSIHIFQGYGQTETTAAVTLKPMDYYDFDNVGIPFPGNKIKLKSVVGYDANCGEILVKGDNVTKGYFKRPEQTKDLFDEDGWCKTGDIAKFENGIFKIVGRRKEIFKTSLGEYIVPDKIEGLFTGGIIQDMFVTGSMYSDKIAAIVVCKDQSVTLDDVMKHIKKLGIELFEKKKIAKFEIPTYGILIRQGFETFCNGDFLTPTSKKRRYNIERYFRKELNELLK